MWKCFHLKYYFPDGKVQGANMGPIWGLQDPDGPHAGPMNFAIWKKQYPWFSTIRQQAITWNTLIKTSLSMHIIHSNIMQPITFQTQGINRLVLIVVSISIIKVDLHIIFTNGLYPSDTEVVNKSLVLGVPTKDECMKWLFYEWNLYL